MTIKPVKGRLIVDEVADALRAEVLGGAVPEGELLPPERSLAQKLGVSRLTLRAALSRLIAQGLVSARQGDGIRVLDFRRNSTLEVLIDLLGFLRGKPATKLLKDLLEARRFIACEVVRLACARYTPITLAPIRIAIEELEEAVAAGSISRESIFEHEMAISHALVDAADNQAFKMVLNTLERLQRIGPRMGSAAALDPAALVSSYRQLLARVERRDAEGAVRHISETMQALDEATLRQSRRDK